MTYNVFGGTLNLTQSINQSVTSIIIIIIIIISSSIVIKLSSLS